MSGEVVSADYSTPPDEYRKDGLFSVAKNSGFLKRVPKPASPQAVVDVVEVVEDLPQHDQGQSNPPDDEQFEAENHDASLINLLGEEIAQILKAGGIESVESLNALIGDKSDESAMASLNSIKGIGRGRATAIMEAIGR